MKSIRRIAVLALLLVNAALFWQLERQREQLEREAERAAQFRRMAIEAVEVAERLIVVLEEHEAMDRLAEQQRRFAITY